jgi:hypothetical protein
MQLEWARQEMAAARVKDQRRIKSLIRICAATAEEPERSLSGALGPGLRQAMHRIGEHEDTTVNGLLAGHLASTQARCREHPVVLIASDTTAFVYRQLQMEGLAPVNGSDVSRGLFGHGALAGTPDGTPLGLLHLEFWGADAPAPAPPLGPKRPPEDRESYKWIVALQAVGKALPAETRGILIADREADIFRYLSEPRPGHLELLVRASHNRCVAPGPAGAEEASEATCTERGKLFSVAAGAPVLGTCRVQIPARPAQGGSPARAKREAVLELRATEVWLQPPAELRKERAVQRVWVVQAQEVDPPDKADPISWVLLTTIPVPDAATAARMVAYYTRRWLIERLHFTLKSGLRSERLQIDDSTSLKHCLALYYVVAWRLLYLTHLAREEPDRPAVEVLETVELEVLRAVTKRPVETAQDALIAIALLAGYAYYRNAPPPGVKTIWHGLQRLAAMVLGWQAARAGKSLAELMTHD